jgi:hypothetical protein
MICISIDILLSPLIFQFGIKNKLTLLNNTIVFSKKTIIYLLLFKS